MDNILLLSSIVLILCVYVYKFLSRFGVPMLLGFMGIGILFGENGIFKISYNDFNLSNDICTIALIFIIFYGGFGTNLSTAKGIIKKSIILSTLGVFFTALLSAGFCYYVLGYTLQISLLIGAVLSSTDAASVFSILRSYKLNLKESTAPLLEIESGSNDPFAYVLTITFLSMSNFNWNDTFIMLFKQIIFGLLLGFLLAKFTIIALRKIKVIDSGFIMAFIMGTMLLSYSMSTVIGGNGYISVYLFGIMVGNSRFNNKKEIVHFFDGVTNIMQMLIFFLLGLLVNPLDALEFIYPATILMLAMTFVIRPFVIYFLMFPLKSSNNQKIIVSWSGLRGAASIVFSILVVVRNVENAIIVFNIAFIVVILSIAIQGSFIPIISKKLNMIDEKGDVLKTFNDYSEGEDIDFITFNIDNNHDWIGKKIKDINLMPSVLLVLIIRNNKNIIPDGNTIICKDDKVVLCGSSFVDKESRIRLIENNIDKNSNYYNKLIKDIEDDLLIIMVKRNDNIMIPTGNTLIKDNDTLVMLDRVMVYK